MNKKKCSYIIILFLISIACANITFGFLFNESSEVVNVFKSPNLDFEIIEEFDGNIKENVIIKSLGDVPMYLRVKLVFSVEDVNGNTLAENININDFAIEGFNGDNWIIKDNVYYYKHIVQPKETVNLFDKVTVNKDFNGNIPVLTILADGVQSSAVTKVWNVNIDENGGVY